MVCIDLPASSAEGKIPLYTLYSSCALKISNRRLSITAYPDCVMFSRHLTERFSLDVSIVRISATTNSSDVEKRLAGIKDFARGLWTELQILLLFHCIRASRHDISCKFVIFTIGRYVCLVVIIIIAHGNRIRKLMVRMNIRIKPNESFL